MMPVNPDLRWRRRALLQCLWLLPTATLAQSNAYDVGAERFALDFMGKYSLTLRDGEVNLNALAELYELAVDRSRISFEEFHRARVTLGEVLKYAPTRGRGSDRQERRGESFVITLRCSTGTGSWNMAVGLLRPENIGWKVGQIQLEPD